MWTYSLARIQLLKQSRNTVKPHRRRKPADIVHDGQVAYVLHSKSDNTDWCCGDLLLAFLSRILLMCTLTCLHINPADVILPDLKMLLSKHLCYLLLKTAALNHWKRLKLAGWQEGTVVASHAQNAHANMHVRVLMSVMFLWLKILDNRKGKREATV